MQERYGVITMSCAYVLSPEPIEAAAASAG